MRTSDQTYLSKLGFQDPDKKNPLHDQICTYLSLPEKTQKLIQVTAKDLFEKALRLPSENSVETMKHPTDRFTFDQRTLLENLEKEMEKKGVNYAPWKSTLYLRNTVTRPAPTLEFTFGLSSPIIKGVGQYKTVVGYADFLIDFGITRKVNYSTSAAWIVQEGKEIPISEEILQKIFSPSCDWVFQKAGRILVEVKAGNTPVLNVLQQLHTYREYLRDSATHLYFVLCTGYLLSQAEKDTLMHANISHIYVDPIKMSQALLSTAQVVREPTF